MDFLLNGVDILYDRIGRRQMIISEENINKLKFKAYEYMELLSEVRNADFNAGQAYAINLMFQWIMEMQNDNQ
jgi:hypothetical protein